MNLADSAWRVRQGQAIWKRGRHGPEISGDLLVATRRDGRSFVQFSKNPFPIFVGQSGPVGWQVEIPVEKKRYAGPGKPPKRLLLLYLPRVLAGEPVPRGWRWEKLDENGWRLASSRESVEVYFFE